MTHVNTVGRAPTPPPPPPPPHENPKISPDSQKGAPHLWSQDGPLTKEQQEKILKELELAFEFISTAPGSVSLDVLKAAVQKILENWNEGALNALSSYVSNLSGKALFSIMGSYLSANPDSSPDDRSIQELFKKFEEAMKKLGQVFLPEQYFKNTDFSKIMKRFFQDIWAKLHKRDGGETTPGGKKQRSGGGAAQHDSGSADGPQGQSGGLRINAYNAFNYVPKTPGGGGDDPSPSVNPLGKGGYNGPSVTPPTGAGGKNPKMTGMTLHLRDMADHFQDRMTYDAQHFVTHVLKNEHKRVTTRAPNSLLVDLLQRSGVPSYVRAFAQAQGSVAEASASLRNVSTETVRAPSATLTADAEDILYARGRRVVDASSSRKNQGFSQGHGAAPEKKKASDFLTRTTKSTQSSKQSGDAPLEKMKLGDALDKGRKKVGRFKRGIKKAKGTLLRAARNIKRSALAKVGLVTYKDIYGAKASSIKGMAKEKGNEIILVSFILLKQVQMGEGAVQDEIDDVEDHYLRILDLRALMTLLEESIAGQKNGDEKIALNGWGTGHFFPQSTPPRPLDFAEDSKDGYTLAQALYAEEIWTPAQTVDEHSIDKHFALNATTREIKSRYIANIRLELEALVAENDELMTRLVESNRQRKRQFQRAMSFIEGATDQLVKMLPNKQIA